MSFEEDDLKIAIAMFEAFDLPKVPTIKVKTPFREEATVYVLGTSLGVMVRKRRYNCNSNFILTLVAITNCGTFTPVSVLGRFYHKTLLSLEELEEELFHLNYYIEIIERVKKPSKEYYDIAKELLKRIGKEPGIHIYYTDVPWGVLAPLDEEKRRKKEIKESLEKVLKRFDELELEKLEKIHRYFKGLTTPAPKEEIKVKFYGMGENKKMISKEIKIETLKDILNLKDYEDEKIKIINILGIKKEKRQVDVKGIFGTSKKITKEIIVFDECVDIEILIKPTEETIIYSFISGDTLIHTIKELFIKLHSDETIGFTGRKVANFIKENMDSKFIILTSLEKFIRVAGVICGSGSKEIKTGTIIPKEHYQEVIDGFERVKFFTNVIGMDCTDWISDCPGSSFSDLEEKDEKSK